MGSAEDVGMAPGCQCLWIAFRDVLLCHGLLCVQFADDLIAIGRGFR